MKEQGEHDDDRNRDAQQPEKNASTHDALLSLFLAGDNASRRLSVPFEECEVARLAALIGLAVFLFLQNNVGTYFAPQDRFLFKYSAPLRIGGVGRQTQALLGFVLIPLQDRHPVTMRQPR